MKTFNNCQALLIAAVVVIGLSGCATESSRPLDVPVVSSAQKPYAGKPVGIAVRGGRANSDSRISGTVGALSQR